ncbi:serine hydrolase domain-containing protein [Novosphingobium olei]|uniref:serine hydrolase domain-containing protein n=1 Tax=Novosphingobium olei TaxID=2728851 RepID=UPI00308A5F0A|nr:serine hydrolase [Novosphingobium olei]
MNTRSMRVRTLLAGLALPLATLAPAVAARAEPAAPAAPVPGTTAIPVGTGATIVPPEGWSQKREGQLVRFVAPEGDASAVIVPIASARNADDAAMQAFALARPGFSRAIDLTQPLPPREGWDDAAVTGFDVPPAEKAIAQAIVLRKGTSYTVVAIEGALATLAKRNAQLRVASDTLKPAGFTSESFAGKAAHRFDATRVEALKRFVLFAMQQLKIPGVGLAVVDHGKVVYEGGLGVKDLATGTPVDADTLFMIASNTKGMSTLLLATLVDQGKLDWNQPVTRYMPEFRLGDEATTRKVLVKHLICACTGLPRRDMEWLFNTSPSTPATATFDQLAASQPTSGFGEVFQYNNLMASAAGYLGARLIAPGKELGAAYDKAMQDRIFTPLGMRDTTMSNIVATAGNWARPYDLDIDGKVALIDMKFNDTVVPYRPAGGAWSSAHDMARYVLDELDQGRLPNGKRLVSATNLLARRVHNVPVADQQWYGMGLEDSIMSGVSVIHHGGSMFGYKSDWFAVPSAQVGIVVLTNSEMGYDLTKAASRRMIELLYDGAPKAAQQVAVAARQADLWVEKNRSQLDRNVSPEEARRYVGNYANRELGPLTVTYADGVLHARATSIWSDLALKKNADGSTSLATISPGASGFEFLATTRDGKRALVLQDPQREYVLLETTG